jgi:hypothetical protein
MSLCCPPAVDGGYVYNLNGTGLASGRYSLLFVVSGDPTTHQAQFMVRKFTGPELGASVLAVRELRRTAHQP